MVRHAPLPYVTPGFISEVRRQYFGKDPRVTCGKVVESLERINDDLDMLGKEDPPMADLYGRLIDDISKARQDAVELAQALRRRESQPR